MKRILINYIPHDQQRYETVGDWYYDPDGNLIINVSNDHPDYPTKDEQFLVALHELIEVTLCRKRGITQEQVDDFDMMQLGSMHAKYIDDEPGDHYDAPYRNEHRFACLIEHLMAHEMGIVGYGVVR